MSSRYGDRNGHFPHYMNTHKNDATYPYERDPKQRPNCTGCASTASMGEHYHCSNCGVSMYLQAAKGPLCSFCRRGDR